MSKVKSILQYLNSLSPAAKASFWFVVSNVMLKGISFITTPIFTRILNVADYGTTSVFVTWECVISIFATLSLSGGVYNVAMTKFEEDIEAFTSSMIGLTALSSSLTYALCMAINYWIPSLFQLEQSFLFYMWIQTFANAITSFWMMRKRFEYKYKSVITYTFANSLVSPVIAIIAIYLFPENRAYAKIVGAGVLAIAIGFYIGAKTLFRGKKFYQKTYWNYALKFNIPLIPHYLSSIILGSSDRLMINYFCGSAQAGIYSIANSITGLIGIVTESINYSLIPYTLQAIKKRTIDRLYRVVSGCVMLVSIICIFVILFAREGIMLFATRDYIAAVGFIAPLAFSTQLAFISGLLGNILFYYEQTKFMSLITMVTALVNVVLNVVGIQLWGYIAAGYTTLFSSFLRLVLYYLCVRKFEKDIDEILNLKWIFMIFTVFIIAMVLSIAFNNNMVVKMIIIVVVFAVVFFFRKTIVQMITTMLEKKKED